MLHMYSKIKFAIISIFFFTTLRAQIYSLEPLVNEATKHPAPIEIQQKMYEIESKNLQECLLYNQKMPKTNYFSAIKIKIHPTKKSYLVFPSKYCKAFFGAHAIAYWLFCQNNKGKYVNVYSGKSDGIEIRKNKQSTFNNIESFYGNSSIELTFDTEKFKYIRDDSK